MEVKASLLLSRCGVTLLVSCCNLSSGWCVIGYHVVLFHSCGVHITTDYVAPSFVMLCALQAA